MVHTLGLLTTREVSDIYRGPYQDMLYLIFCKSAKALFWPELGIVGCGPHLGKLAPSHGSCQPCVGKEVFDALRVFC